MSFQIPSGYKLAFSRRKVTNEQKLWDIVGNIGDFPNSYVCGGYARESLARIPNGNVGDIDIYCLDKTTLDNVATALHNTYPLDKENDFCISFRKFPDLPIQLIKCKMGTVGEILDTFDFTIVRAALLGPTGGIVGDDFEEDNFKRLLKIRKIEDPMKSFLRMIKYSKKGFYLPPSELVKVILSWEDTSEEYKKRNIDKYKDMVGLYTKKSYDDLYGNCEPTVAVPTPDVSWVETFIGSESSNRVRVGRSIDLDCIVGAPAPAGIQQPRTQTELFTDFNEEVLVRERR